jgi:hypothetical protein
MTEKTLFISSCSRREMARRRPTRSVARGGQWLWLAVVLLGALAVLLMLGAV